MTVGHSSGSCLTMVFSGLQKVLNAKDNVKLFNLQAFNTSTYMAAPMIVFISWDTLSGGLGQYFWAFDPQSELSHGWGRHHTCPPGVAVPYACVQSSSCPVILLVGSHVQKIPKLPSQCQLVHGTSLEAWNGGSKVKVQSNISAMSLKGCLKISSLQASSRQWAQQHDQCSCGSSFCSFPFMSFCSPMLTEAPSVPPPMRTSLPWSKYTWSIKNVVNPKYPQ